MSCGVGHRRGSDPALLWLWCRPATTAPMRPLAWEPPHAEGAALKKKKTKKNHKKNPSRSKRHMKSIQHDLGLFCVNLPHYFMAMSLEKAVSKPEN